MFPLDWAPTYEGIKQGTVQILRLLVMLSALTIVLATTTKEQLISGIFFLARPLSRLGFSAERFAVRLWLTLHYVEMRIEAKKLNLVEDVEQLLDGRDAVDDRLDMIEISMPHFRKTDWMFAIALLFVGYVAI